MDFYLSYFEEWSNFVKISFFVCIGFISLSLLLICTVFYLRIHKVISNRRKEALITVLLNFITAYLFDENFNKNEEILRLKNKELVTDLDKEVAIHQILIFNENLKGESTSGIKDLFFGLRLHDFLFSKLNSKEWYKRASALFVLSELSITVPPSKIHSLINHKQVEVRQQALFHILKLSQSDPLEFLVRINRPLTLWQQIHIENSLKNDYKGEIPDFSQWLNHKFTNVVRFSIRMMGEFNQFQNIPKLVALLNSQNNIIRVEIMRCLCKMGHSEIIPILISNFWNESLDIQYEILNIIKKIGTYDQFNSLAPTITKKDNSVKVKYFNIDRSFKTQPLI